MTIPNVINNAPYLRTSREFPLDAQSLAQETNKSYVDIAAAVNNRTISLFPTARPAITGESYFFPNTNRQQSFRQVYILGAVAAGATVTVNHNIVNLNQFTRIYGTCITDQPDYRPIPYASVVATANIDLRVDSTYYYVSVGADSPDIVSGLIVLEYFA